MKAEGYINAGYQRLLTFEVGKSGGWSWGGESPAVKVLTAYGLMQFHDMSKVFEIDENIVPRISNWLLSQQQEDGSFEGDSRAFHTIERSFDHTKKKLITTAFITYALTESNIKDPRVDKAVDYLKNNYQQMEDPYLLGLFANALVSVNPKDPLADDLLRKLMAMKTEENEAVHWGTKVPTMTCSSQKGASIEATSLVTCALLKADREHPTVNKAITFLVRSKDAYGTWHSTQATTMAIRTLIQSLRRSSENVSGQGQVLINGSKAAEFSISAEDFDVFRLFDLKEHTRPGKNVVQIKFQGKGSSLWRITGKYYLPWQGRKVEKQKEIDIDVSYDRRTLMVNDTVRCDVRVKNLTAKTNLMTIVDLGVPPGFTVETSDLEKLVSSKTIDKYSVSGRQVILYFFEMAGGKEARFSYRLTARYPLRAQAPSSRAYLYYSPEENAVTKPQDIVVQQ
jgi:hypothetical protein